MTQATIKIDGVVLRVPDCFMFDRSAGILFIRLPVMPEHPKGVLMDWRDMMRMDAQWLPIIAAVARCYWTDKAKTHDYHNRDTTAQIEKVLKEKDEFMDYADAWARVGKTK